MAECIKQTEESKMEGLFREGVHSNDFDDLAVFRWLDQQITNKKAITACLLVLQGSACSEEPLGVGLAAKT